MYLCVLLRWLSTALTSLPSMILSLVTVIDPKEKHTSYETTVSVLIRGMFPLIIMKDLEFLHGQKEEPFPFGG